MQNTAPPSIARARLAAAATALLALAVIVGGALATAGLVYAGHLDAAIGTSVGTFAAFYYAQGVAFDALDRLGEAHDQRSAPPPRQAARPVGSIETRVDVHLDALRGAQLATPSRLLAVGQDPGRHRPETFAATHAMPAIPAQRDRRSA